MNREEIKEAAARDEILARLAQSRAEIRRVLEPPSADSAEERPAGEAGDVFPRSRTMQALLSGRGLGAAGAVLGGLLLARPALAWRLVKLLPTSALARMFLVKVTTALRAKHE
jgi:hypothetical protein